MFVKRALVNQDNIVINIISVDIVEGELVSWVLPENHTLHLISDGVGVGFTWDGSSFTAPAKLPRSRKNEIKDIWETRDLTLEEINELMKIERGL